MSKLQYQLVEKSERGVAPRRLDVSLVPKTKDTEEYTEVLFQRGSEPQHYLGSTIEETKRGWTVKTVQFSGSECVIFLPRNKFTKIGGKAEKIVDPAQTSID